jgi:serine phosphatase RsbU (regulator of sigma subunit)
LCVIDKKKRTLTFSGAKNSLVYVRNNEVYQIKGDRYSVGDPLENGRKIFTNHVVSLEDDPVFYMFSDGYQDQFGGMQSKKFMISKLKELLLKIHTKDMRTQRRILEKTINNWMVGQDQIDDILVMGFHGL